MLKLAVVGKDVSKSLSPGMNAFILGKMGVRCSYDRVSVPPERFGGCAEALFGKYDGFNVTIPFKRDILPFLRECRGEALRLGAVNTVCTKERTGYNTDGYGFRLMLAGAGVCVRGKRVLVLGAGGAGRSCIAALTELGASVSVYERDRARLHEVFRLLGGFKPLETVETVPYDVIVNCTGVGMHDTVGRLPGLKTEHGEVPLPEALMSAAGCAVDLIYEPAVSAFLRSAIGCGKPAFNGAPMLFYQAYRSDCYFLGKAPSDEEAKALWTEWNASPEGGEKENI